MTSETRRRKWRWLRHVAWVLAAKAFLILLILAGVAIFFGSGAGNPLIQRYVVRNLIKPELKSAQDPRALIKALVGPASYLIGAAAAWVSVHAALVIYLLTPLFYITPPAWHGNTEARPNQQKP